MPADTQPLIDQSVLALRDSLARQQGGAAALVDELIARTEARRDLNSYVHFDADGLQRQALAADRRLAAGERLPLLGVPIALKDNIDAEGLPTGNGTAALHGRIARRDAAVVRRLRDAGALITGKLGMHELAFGITSNNAVTGAVRNPWDPSRIPGGSSGGSGAAVAARLVPAALGTDTGGSIRVPAALCGVTGLRPTAGRLGGQGLAPISTTRDTAGPIARSVADLALLDAVLSGDSAWAAASLKGLSLGLPAAHFWENLEPGVAEQAGRALERLRAAGARIVPVDLPDLMAIDAEVSFPVALYEFVRDLGDYLEQSGHGLSLATVVEAIGSPDVKGIATPLLAGGAIPEAVYRQAISARARLQQVYAEAFARSGVEALLFPTTPRTAAPIGEDETVLLNGVASPTFATFIRNTDAGSNAGLPGISLPCGLADGLPVGLALDGPIRSDRRLLAIAAAVEAVLPPMPAPPSR